MNTDPHNDSSSYIDELLHEESWLEKCRRIHHGLGQPPETGEYKWARHEFKRIVLPGFSSALSMLLLFLCLVVFLTYARDDEDPITQVELIDKADLDPELDKLDPVKDDSKEDMIEEECFAELISEQITDASSPPLMENPVTDVSHQLISKITMPMATHCAFSLNPAFGHRIGEQRTAAIKDFGGEGTEDAVLKSLRWLKHNQDSDGAWTMGTPATPGAGLGLLCFLAYGATPQHEEFGPTVEKAIKYLVSKQQKDGNWMDTGSHHVYGNAIANYAIAEAFAMTQIYSLKEVMDSGIQVIIDGQQAGGGWDYNYKDAGRTDLSVMAWQAQALKAAKMAGSEAQGLDEAIYKCVPAFKTFQGRQGGFGYTSPGDKPLAAAGVLCLQLLGESAAPEVHKGLEYMYSWKMNWSAPSLQHPVYHWYYATQATFQAGGENWKNWNNMMKPSLIKNQAKDGHWDNAAAKVNSPVYTTTLSCLMLQVYSRLLPTFQLGPDHSPKALMDEKGMASREEIIIKIL